MNSIRLRDSLFIGFFFIIFFGYLPATTEAQYSSYGTSAYRSKINKLDDDIVKNIPIPILFGLSLTMLTPNFGDPRGGGTRTHEGLDIMAPQGAPIISPTDAVVIKTGNGSGSGKYVTTANPGGETFVYMHLNEISVTNGAVLKKGALIGYVGNTGNASDGAPHLHFEIRQNRKAIDPFKRITKEITLIQKMGILEDILEKVKNEDDFIELLLEEYLGVFYQARAEGITLPKTILNALPAHAPVPTHDLDIGAEGSDVMALQSVLITLKYLPLEAPTGHFGAITQKALRAYQEANLILPATGYYGPMTRASMQKGTVPSIDSRSTMTLEEMVAKISELTLLLEELQAQENEERKLNS